MSELSEKAKEARRNLAKSILAMVDAASGEDAKVEAIAEAFDKLAKQAFSYGMMQGKLSGVVGFKSNIDGSTFLCEDKKIKCKKCEKEIIERYAKQRLGFCKACFEAGLNEGEVIR